MGTVLRFPPPVNLLSRRRQERTLRAKELIYDAVELLSGMGEGETRVAWLLEDCVSLLDADGECPALHLEERHLEERREC